MAAHAQLPLASDDVWVEIGDDAKEKEPGKIKTLSSQNVHVFLRKSLPFGSLVRVWLSPDCSVEGQSMDCRAEGAGYCARIQLMGEAGANRRQEPRFQASGETATIFILDGEKGGTIEARLVDVSKSGLGLSTAERLPRGTWVKVELPSAIAFGEVMHCRETAPSEYRIGLLTERILFRTEPEHTAPGRGARSVLKRFFRF